jgi:DNA primase catalytic core
MARIPDEELERLKAEVSLERLAEARGVVLARHGADLLGLCPFHDDREPSLVISPAKNLWHCMGACGAGGSVIDWVMRAEGVSFRHAVELLRADLVPVGSGPPPKRASTRHLPSPVVATAADAELLSQVVAFYHEALKASPDAMAYLERRRIGHPEALERFRLGLSDRSLGYRLPERNRKEGAELRGRLQALGILRPSGHEHFAGSLVLPVADLEGTVTEVYGRKLRDDLRPGTPAHLYLPGPHAGVWNPEALVASKEIVLCESLIDALSLWCAGFRHATASYGTEGFTADHLAAFRTHGTERVLIAYDRDAAGDKAADALAKQLMAEGIECFRVLLPRGEDANSFACAAGSATEALGRVIRAAEWMGAGDKKRLHWADPVTSAQWRAAGDGAAKEENGARPSVSSFAAELPAASPVPALPDDPGHELVGDELRLVLGERRWRVRGLAKCASFDLLRVNVMVSRADMRDGQVFHVDTLDLYSARARTTFVKQTAAELGLGEEVVKTDLGRVMLACEAVADDAVAAAQAPAEPAVVLSEAEEAAAMALLRDPKLVERIVADVARAGIVGEATNALVGYLAAVSRKLDTPLAVIVQSTTAAGKSSLMDAVLGFVPDEECIKFSAMTGQSLFYMGEADLAHKVLAVVEEEGAERAAYALKLLQSEGELSIASTGKDTTTGRLVTHTYTVAGPVAIFLTTTAVDVDEELLNRCVVLTVDEDRDQTRAIHDRQRARQTLEGLLADHERSRVIKLHQDAQRLLRPVLVANPYAPRLGFADERTRTRRDHMKYLTLIRVIALLHQHQRPRRSVTHDGQTLTYIEVTLDDIALANRLAHEVLGRSLDELAPQTRRLLGHVTELVVKGAAGEDLARCDVRFTRRQVREHCGWSDFQVRTHLDRLVALEYVLVHRGGRGQSFVYELLWDGGADIDGRPHLVGLVDVATLAQDRDLAVTTPDFEGPNAEFEGPLSPQRAPNEGGSRSPRNDIPPGSSRRINGRSPETAHQGNGSGSHTAIGGSL